MLEMMFGQVGVGEAPAMPMQSQDLIMRLRERRSSAGERGQGCDAWDARSCSFFPCHSSDAPPPKTMCDTVGSEEETEKKQRIGV